MGNKRFTFIVGDIADPDFVRTVYRDNRIDTTINVAAESHVDNSIKNPSLFTNTNSYGTAVLLQNHQQNDAGRFLQVSTDEVYGSITEGSWTEDFPLSPRSPYSASKAAADLIALSFHKTYQTDVVITRCCNNYGPRQFPEKIIPLFITNLIQGKTIPIYGEGLNRREWIHVDDHCYGIIKTLTHGLPGEVHHIGADTELANIELAREICKQLNKDFSTTARFVEDRKGHDFRYSLNDKKTRHHLGIEPTIDFEIGLRSTIEWYVNNEEWWRPLVRN
jgi:dTDP-glucose 4,6-dehydratase